MFYTHKICNKRKNINVSYKFFNPTIIIIILYIYYGKTMEIYMIVISFLTTKKQNKLLYKISKINQIKDNFNYYSESSFSVPFSSSSEPEKPNQPE